MFKLENSLWSISFNWVALDLTIQDIENQKIVSVKDVYLETKGKGFQGTVYVEIESDGKSLVYDILGNLNEGPLERPNFDIKDMGRMIDASFSSLSKSKSLDHVEEIGAIFLPWMFWNYKKYKESSLVLLRLLFVFYLGSFKISYSLDNAPHSVAR